MIYVDDILLLAEEQEIVAVRDAFVKAFQWITMEIGDTHSYGHGFKITGRMCYRRDEEFYREDVRSEWREEPT